MIQSIIFEKSKYTTKEAREYLKKHNIKPLKRVHITDEYLRYRINEPNKKYKYSTIKIKEGLKYILMNK